MSPLAGTYFSAAIDLLKRIAEVNQPTLHELGPVLGRVVAAGGVIHTFGSGHSEMIAREIVGRAGGLVCVSGIFDPGGGFSENLAGYGTKLAERYDRAYGLRSGEAVVIVSNSGKNASPLEVARYAKERGLTVIGLTSVAMAQADPAPTAAGRNLAAIADHVLDNGGVSGDALVEVAGGVRAGPTSTLAGALLLNLLFLEIIAWLQAGGHPLPVLRSQNLPGAIEHNRALARRYAGRLSRPLA
jgi:uncharacterized phosphosugar-binding protein